MKEGVLVIIGQPGSEPDGAYGVIYGDIFIY